MHVLGFTRSPFWYCNRGGCGLYSSQRWACLIEHDHETGPNFQSNHCSSKGSVILSLLINLLLETAIPDYYQEWALSPKLWWHNFLAYITFSHGGLNCQSVMNQSQSDVSTQIKWFQCLISLQHNDLQVWSNRRGSMVNIQIQCKCPYCMCPQLFVYIGIRVWLPR